MQSTLGQSILGQSTLGKSRHVPRLAEPSAYGVQALTDAEAMTANGGVLPLFGVIAAIVGADAAIMALGFGMLAMGGGGNDDELFCPAVE